MMKTEKVNVKREVMTMKKAMKILVEKMMARTHKAVKIYQLELQKKQDMTPARWNMLYGKYLLDMDEAI
jgi:thiaminase